MASPSFPPHDRLRAAANLPAVKQARAEADKELSTLRFHEGLRRQWEAARAEAAIREATALSLMEGARISVSDLRELSMREVSPHRDDMDPPMWRDPAHALAIGLWRAQWNVALNFAPLNARGGQRHRSRPLPALMTALHRDMCSGLVEAGLMPAHTVAIPTAPHELARIVALIKMPLPAWICAAEVCARFRVTPVFSTASTSLGAALARWVLVERGVDPSGVAVISALHTEDVVGSEAALAAWQTGVNSSTPHEEAVAHIGQWYEFFARSVTEGARIGRDVALRVQAGRL